VDEPVEGMIAVTVSVWSRSNFAALMDGVDAAVSAELTVIVEDAEDVVVSGVEALSVTLSSKL
jgi:hypothetical protein